jgi:hypothetical protein
MRHLTHMLLFISLVTIAACSQPAARISADHEQAQSFAETPMAVQLIIKFRDHGAGPLRDDLVQELSRDAGAVLIYVRPMSGGAHVLRLQRSSDASQLSEVIRRLGKRADVEYVEEDRIMHHQQRQ